MRECELCGLRARMYCESDQASLCWDCDEKVHGANFLVAKHSRSLLCHACHAPTPWKASGPKLTPTVSVCEACADCNGRRLSDDDDAESQGENDEEEDESEETFDGHGGFDEDGENQVVPWSFSSSSPPSLDGASSSSDRDIIADLDSDEETTSSGSLRSPKRRRLNEEESTREMNHGQSESARSTAIIRSIQRLQNDAVPGAESATATILGICKLSRDHSR